MPLKKHVYCVAVTFKMTEWVEHQICIKFCVKLEHSSVETIRMIQKTFGDDAMSAALIQVWHKHFKDGQKSVESDPRWKACNEQNTWECWMCTGCNQQRSTTDGVRTRSWSGDSKNYCVRGLDAGSWHEMCHGKICSDLIQTATSEPDLVPCNFGLFPKLKSPLKGKRFQTVNESGK